MNQPNSESNKSPKKFNDRMNRIAWHPFTLGFICGMWFMLLFVWIGNKL